MANSTVENKCYLCDLFGDYNRSDILSQFAAQHKCLKRNIKSDKKYESSEKLQIHENSSYSDKFRETENNSIGDVNSETDDLNNSVNLETTISETTIPENKILVISHDFVVKEPAKENDTGKQQSNMELENIREQGYSKDESYPVLNEKSDEALFEEIRAQFEKIKKILENRNKNKEIPEQYSEDKSDDISSDSGSDKDYSVEETEDDISDMEDFQENIKHTLKKTNSNVNPKCKKNQVNRKQDFNRQIKTVHGKQRDNKCEICGKSFGDHLNRHIKAVHEEVRYYKCEICGKSFAQKPHLKRHLKAVHERERKYKCDYCRKEFFRKEQKERHERNIHNIV